MKKIKWHKLAKEYVVSLFPIFMLADAAGLNMKKKWGVDSPIAFKIENRTVDWLYLPEKWATAHNFFVGRIKRRPDFLRAILEKMEELGKKQALETKSLKKVDAKFSDRALWAAYDAYVKTNLEVYAYGLVLPFLDYQKNTFLSDELHNILQRRQGAEKFFGPLTIPLRATHNRLQDIALLQLLALIKKDPRLELLFKKTAASGLRQILRQKYPKIYQKINRHTENFCWVYYVYEGPASVRADFIDLLKDLLLRKVNPSKELSKQRREAAALQAWQKKTMRKLKLSVYERKIVELARDSVFYKAYRRELQSWSYFHAEFLLREIARRLNVSLQQARMMLPQELKTGLLRHRVDVDGINERMKMLVYGAPKIGSCLAGEAATKYLKEHYVREKIGRLPKFVSGAAAYKGKAQGVACVVNAPEEMKKMRPGGILIAGTTNPNLMPAIRQAAAIVTDEGGLTCHAAIVSRELKIPCVVGTNIATSAFKDGDLVEVDANKGIVRKL